MYVTLLDDDDDTETETRLLLIISETPDSLLLHDSTHGPMIFREGDRVITEHAEYGEVLWTHGRAMLVAMGDVACVPTSCPPGCSCDEICDDCSCREEPRSETPAVCRVCGEAQGHDDYSPVDRDGTCVCWRCT